MNRPGFGLGVLTLILVLLLWWLFAPTVSEPMIREPSSQGAVPSQQDISRAGSAVDAKKRAQVVPRFEPLARVVPEVSESEKMAEGGVSAPQPDYPEKPEVPEYEMPEGPEIMPFAYQRLLFKNAPDNERVGVALYVTVTDPARRKHAYLQRTYLAQLTAFLASHYEFDAIKTEAGKAKFVDMLKIRFGRRLKGNLLKDLDYAFFETVD